jgi:ATP-dependent RNA helicase DeaD
MATSPFSALGLSDDILKAVEQMGFQEPSAIQAATIPALLSGKDVAGLSRTGSGKTAAFAIPAVQCVDPKLKKPQVLILCPTRELAVQVAGEVAKLSAFKRGVTELAIYGGSSYGAQYRGLEDGAQIIAGTPGRIMDHLDRGSLKLEHIRMIIMDEADRMLDMGFRDDMAAILSQAPEERQTAFFSATMPSSVEHLIKSYTKTPQWVKLETRAEAAPDIDQCYYEISHGSRIGALCRVLESTSMRFGIIFCSTKNAVDGVTEHLIQEGYQADRLHGDMSQAMRERVMRRFREHKLEFLVATDVAARGIDVDDVEAVINYDLPRDAEDYVHRIGRTGRAGRSGKAISFITAREFWLLDRIQRMTRIRIRRERVPTPLEAAKHRTDALVTSAVALADSGTFSANPSGVQRLLAATPSPEAAIEVLLHMLTHRKAAAPKGEPHDAQPRTQAQGDLRVPTPHANPSERPQSGRPGAESQRKPYHRKESSADHAPRDRAERGTERRPEGRPERRFGAPVSEAQRNERPRYDSKREMAPSFPRTAQPSRPPRKLGEKKWTKTSSTVAKASEKRQARKPANRE